MNKRTKWTNRLLEITLWLCSAVTIYPLLMLLMTSCKSLFK
jgi:raffinose/stachyose/melibiose transport system permease protein